MSRHQNFWTFTRKTFCKVLASKYRVTFEENSDPEPEPPFILISNHGNFFDPWILGNYQKTALNIMMNDDGFRTGAISRWYLNIIGAFAKKKGAQDLQAMKKTISFLRHKEPVLIFPEGQATWDGETQPIYGGVERIVKRAKCALVIIRLKGNFLTRPWWAEHSRRGRISFTRKVYSAKQIAQMDAREIEQAILDGIYNNDICDRDNLATTFKGKHLALGAERFLWTCPACGEVDSIATSGDDINCIKCGATFKLDAHCRVNAADGNLDSPLNLHAWHQRDKQLAREKIAASNAGEILCQNTDVTLMTENDERRFESTDVGVLTLTSDKLSFTSNHDGGELDFSVEALENVVVQQKDLFEVTVDGKDYRFNLKGRSPMKWAVFTRYLRGWEEIEKRRVI